MEREGRELDYEPYALVFSFIREKYGPVRGAPHYFRMAAIITFMHKNRKRLVKDKIAIPKSGGKAEIEEALLEAFAKLPFEHKFGFTYKQIRTYVNKAKSPN